MPKPSKRKSPKTQKKPAKSSRRCHADEASNASGRNGPPGQLRFLCNPDEASNARVLCHPDDLSNARGGRTSDSFAYAKPVPVSEIAQRSFSPATSMTFPPQVRITCRNG